MNELNLTKVFDQTEANTNRRISTLTTNNEESYNKLISLKRELGLVAVVYLKILNQSN